MSKQSDSPPIGFIRPMVDFNAKTTERKIKPSSKIRSSEVALDDGSVLSIKPFIIDIRRADKQWNDVGQPLYFVKLGFAINTKAPKKLMRPLPKSKKKR